ncbi:DUF2259 domain-containing protein [Lutimaribacter sp. EGI FJ00015]|uniref:DUF2259 domain-containing protein n=1 Tax=Lutimaribacter degradans TaxID=2945989 RepID=A0ACC5ZXD4_9RHOB|nr:DUF2259 domain-containing protein [Lutimaribacter sp. EGI FJ00013]MCM2562209.1 DUF2259 domain-containing protein [Lutimaribacter sp. EGI FJ00013]MCO0613364.1 DUF2259 domain-containing protein [Lutimaribacter sp. EGI FJ00015]MCO0636338.1 DUF2259 domain-containing protein [Lutimaribacter sp. EGI FJ00014]
MRGAALLFGFLSVLAGSALADYTHDRIIGFSPDGRYVAFETYGLQRGSGLPFSNIFIVDLDRDAWVSGSPVRSRASEANMAEVEAAPYAALSAKREEVRAKSAELLGGLEIRRPATVLFARGIGEAHDAPSRITVARPNPDDPTRPPQATTTFELEEIAVPGGAEFCPRPEALRGYRLTHLRSGDRPQVLHEDSRIPSSRGCPVAYRIDTVASAGHPRPDGRGVALISVWEQGFEGLERSVIAIPVPLPGAAGTTTRASGQSVTGTAAPFVAGYERRDIEQLERAVRNRLPADGSSVFLPDADLPPAARAALLFESEEKPLPHSRSWITVETQEVRPAGAGSPVPVSLISVLRQNLGSARRAALAEIVGADRVAPPETFGIGPNVEWRYAMRPVQGMRAGLVAAGRLELNPQTADRCGPARCGAADPSRVTGAETAPPTADTGVPLPTAADGLPSDAELIGRLFAAGPADAFLVERGLWQDDAVQAVSFVDGSPVWGLIATRDTVTWIRAPRVVGP